jgi:hypothetical protein
MNSSPAVGSSFDTTRLQVVYIDCQGLPILLPPLQPYFKQSGDDWSSVRALKDIPDVDNFTSTAVLIYIV